MPISFCTFENGLPCTSLFRPTAAQPPGGPAVTRAPGGPKLDLTVGSSPKIARFGFGGGNTSRGGFGTGGCVIVLPLIARFWISLTWFARVALLLMFSLL